MLKCLTRVLDEPIRTHNVNMPFSNRVAEVLFPTLEIDARSTQMDHKEKKDEHRGKSTKHIMHEIKDYLSAVHSREKRERVAKRKKKDEDEEESYKEKQDAIGRQGRIKGEAVGETMGGVLVHEADEI